jgi:O-antigen/teichoic acid export membrane protein
VSASGGDEWDGVSQRGGFGQDTNGRGVNEQGTDDWDGTLQGGNEPRRPEGPGGWGASRGRPGPGPATANPSEQDLEWERRERRRDLEGLIDTKPIDLIINRGADTEGVPLELAPADEPAAGGGRRSLMRRAGWNLGDQLISAATNAALSFLVARTVDARGFGAFAVGFLVFTVLIGLGRAIAGQPLSIRYSAVDETTMRDAVARSMGSIIALTVPASVLCALAGLLLGGILRPTLLAFALVLPSLVIQDACRLAFFAQSRPQLATLNDGLWAVVQFAGVTILIVTDQASAWSLALVWGLAAAVCAVLGLVQLDVVPKVAASRDWVRENKDLVGYLSAEFLLGAGALQGGTLLVGIFVGIDDLGSLRAAQVLTGPLSVLFGAAMSFGLPEVSRRATLSSAIRWKIAVAVTGLMFVLGLIYTVILLLIPQSLGSGLLGDTWTGASNVLLPVSLVTAFAGACLGPVIVILALGKTSATFRLTMIEAVMVITAMIVGAKLDGARGAAWGLCIQQALLVPMWFIQLRSILVTTDREQEEPDEDGGGEKESPLSWVP